MLLAHALVALAIASRRIDGGDVSRILDDFPFTVRGTRRRVFVDLVSVATTTAREARRRAERLATRSESAIFSDRCVYFICARDKPWISLEYNEERKIVGFREETSLPPMRTADGVNRIFFE